MSKAGCHKFLLLVWLLQPWLGFGAPKPKPQPSLPLPPLVTQEVSAPLLIAPAQSPDSRRSAGASSPAATNLAAPTSAPPKLAVPLGSGFSRLAPMVVTNPISSHATGVTSALLSGGAPSSVLAPGATSAPATTVGFHPLQPVVGTNGARTPMISLLEWAANLGLPAPRRQADSPQPTYEVATALGRALIRIGSTRATIRGVDVMLGHAPQFVSGEPCLHRIDYQKTLNPLLWPIEPRWGSTNRLIVIDAGHGGRDAGTESVDRRFYERKVTLDWALRLKAILESQGYRVAMTRTNETDLSLAERVFFAESLKADLFVSLHFNSAYPVNNKRGLETYVLTPPGLASSVIREGDDNPRLSFPNNAFDLENLNLAWQIQKSVVARTGAVDRGVQRARWLGVLRGQSRPAILVEGGYLSNAEEARKIGDPGYRQRLAEGVAAGLNALASPSVIESTMTSDNDLPPNRTLN